MLDKARYIVVEGPIGAGKTSLAPSPGGSPQLEEIECT
jgi:deoxyadenosine/deoxycytidine kinase